MTCVNHYTCVWACISFTSSRAHPNSRTGRRQLQGRPHLNRNRQGAVRAGELERRVDEVVGLVELLRRLLLPVRHHPFQNALQACTPTTRAGTVTHNWR